MEFEVFTGHLGKNIQRPVLEPKASMWKFGVWKQMLFEIWEQGKYFNQGEEEKTEGRNQIFKEKSKEGILESR